MSDNPRHGIDGERGVSQVAQRQGRRVSNRTLLLIGVGLLGIIAVVIVRPFGHGAAPASEKPPRIGNLIPAPPIPPTPPAPVVQAAASLPLIPPQPAPAQPQPNLVPAQADRPASTSRPTHVMQSYAAPTTQKPAEAEVKKPERTSVAYKATTFAGTKAGPMGNTALALMPGILLCKLDNDINTEHSGPFICHLPADAITDEGAHVLPRGTMITGNYEATAGQGSRRVLPFSAQLITPKPPHGDRCVAQLGGPMADSLGATGVTGSVDTHFWERFGPAMLLTALDLGTSLAQSALSASGSTYLSFNSGNGAGSLAHDVLQSSINIPPTIEVHHGYLVGIWITQPIDFSDCYSLDPTPAHVADP